MWNINTIKEMDELLAEISKLRVTRPYHLNIIEELHINENAHSRILAKLLQYESANGFVILKSLLTYIVQKHHKLAFDTIQITKPIITQELQRIDLWVRDEEYAVIFENKACDASDQEAQLSRYIDKTIQDSSYKYKNGNNIFIVYLPSTNECDPSEQTWGIYKNDFEDRYVKLSFRDDIINWLKKDVLPNLLQKDYLLVTAITQYVDYLECIYHKNNDETMTTEIRERINSALGINNEASDADKMQQLANCINEYQVLMDNLNEYRSELNMRLTNEGYKEAENYIENMSHIYNFFINPANKHSLSIELEEGKFLLIIDKDAQGWYCQFQRPGDDEDKSIPDKIKELLRPILSRKINYETVWWSYRSTVQESLSDLCSILDVLKLHR